MQSVIINTNYAKFELVEENGTVFERHSGYNKGCFFTEWEETMYLYCSDY